MSQELHRVGHLHERVAAIDHDTDEALARFEGLYEVYGVDRLNFDASLVYARQLDTDRIGRTGPETGIN